MQIQTSKITVSTTEGLHFFNLEDIIRLEASSNYTHIYFTNHKKILTAKVLKDYACALEPMGFLRVHRTHLVNRQHIAFVGNNGSIVMKDMSTAEISRRMKTGVMRALKNAS